MVKEEQCFWLGQDIESREALEYGAPPQDILIEDMEQCLRLEPVPVVVSEDLLLASLIEVPMEVEADGTVLVQEDDTAVWDAAVPPASTMAGQAAWPA